MSETPTRDRIIDEAAHEVRQARIAFAAEHGIDLANDDIFNGPGDPNGIKREVAATLAVFERERDARIAELEAALKQARDHINYGLEHKTDVQNILDRIDRALDPELE